jgi:cytochrome P450
MRTWPPGPPGRFLIGHLHHMRADALGFLTECARQYGDFVPFRLLHRPCVLVSHPRLIDEVLVARARDFTKHFALRLNPRAMGNGLLTSEGDFWRRQRRMAAPAFHPSRLAGYAEMMIDSAERMLAGFADGQVRDLHADMMALTLEIAAATLFGAELGPDAALVEQSVTDLVEAFSERFGSHLPWPE